MKCCQCQGIESQFDAKLAAKELNSYRRRGPRRGTRMRIEALGAEGIKGMTLLDIGGGIGAIQHELLSAGVSSATNVEASLTYMEAAKEEAQRRGHGDRVSYQPGDFVDLASAIEPADIVTLDAVICCYHDMEGLVGLSSQRARKLYGFVYPCDTWWMKVIFTVGNFYFWARRRSFRLFLHPTQAIDTVLRRNGFQQRFYRKTQFFQVVVYAR